MIIVGIPRVYVMFNDFWYNLLLCGHVCHGLYVHHYPVSKNFSFWLFQSIQIAASFLFYFGPFHAQFKYQLIKNQILCLEFEPGMVGVGGSTELWLGRAN